jgi:ABC-type transport system involved in multi-copper enzyme maturation permease subunit
MTERRVPSGLSTALTIAGLTWKRLVRGRALWVSALIAMLPVSFAALRGMTLFGAEEVFAFEILVLAVLAPMFVASSIGEEIEDRTITYLWSRPVPRWAVLAGKLFALVPITIMLSLASWILAIRAGSHAMPPIQSCVALAVGTLTISLLSTGIATLVPKHGMALTVAYLLFFDFPLGVLPAKLQELSISHQIRALSGLHWTEDSLATPAVAIALLATAWAVISVRRIRNLEV